MDDVCTNVSIHNGIRDYTSICHIHTHVRVYVRMMTNPDLDLGAAAGLAISFPACSVTSGSNWAFYVLPGPRKVLLPN